MDKPIVSIERADVGDIVIPWYEAQAIVTSVYPYRGKYPQWFTHSISFTYLVSGVKSGMFVNRR